MKEISEEKERRVEHNNSLKNVKEKSSRFWLSVFLPGPLKSSYNGDADSLVLIRPVHERADGEHVEMVLEITLCH